MDNWINLSHDKAKLKESQTTILQHLIEIKTELLHFLDWFYEEHHNNVYLKNVKEINNRLKSFTCFNEEVDLVQFRSFVCELHSEILLARVLFLPNVGKECNEIVVIINKLYKTLDNVRDINMDIDHVSFILDRIPL